MGGRRSVDVRTVVVAVILSLVTGLAIPAISAAVDAANAAKVDGRHAVGAKSPAQKRKGKLVATGKNGKLPNNIIAKAPNADKLDGVDSSNFLRGLGPARSFVDGGLCDPGADAQYLTCATVTLELSRPGRVALTMNAAWESQVGPSSDRCRFLGPGTSNEQVEFGESTDTGRPFHFGFNEVTSPLEAGTQIFGFECREFNGNTIAFRDRMMTAMYVGEF